MTSPYKLEPRRDLVSLDKEKFTLADPERVKDLIIKTHVHNDNDFVRAGDILVLVMKDKKTVEARYAEPVKRANQAHKALTAERKARLENYEWAERILKDKLKYFNMEKDRRLEEKEVTTTSITPPERRSLPNGITFIKKWKHTITDPDKLPRQYLMPDKDAIARRVNAMGDMANIDGVKVERDDIVRVDT